MSAIKAVVAHYNANRGASIDVPEWSETKEPFKVYFDPITPIERKNVFGENSGIFDNESCVDLLILKAKNKDGEKLFSDADRHDLQTKSDGAIIGRVAMQMALPTDRRALVKN
ncbi:MAG: hypothetical protein ABJJ37_27055 [Roseibium sp.]